MEQILLSQMIPHEILQDLQDAFARYSGMASLISDENGLPVTKGSNFASFCMDMTRKSEKGRSMCRECDRQGALCALKSGKPEVYTCHAGLTDYAAPILLNNKFIGSFTGGQVLTHKADEDFIRKKALEYDIDPEEYVSAVRKIPVMKYEDVEKAAGFLSEMAAALSKIAYERYILLEEKRTIEQTSKLRAELLKKYSDGLNDDLEKLTDFLIRVADDGVEKDDIKTRNLSEQMADNMFRHATKLGDALDYMEIENDDFSIHESIYDIRWLIERKISEQKNRAGKRGDVINCNIGKEVPKLLAGDPSRIGGIIGQCIENSIRYTKKAEIDISVSAKKQGYATLLEIRISDLGVGMEEAERKRIERYITSRGSSETYDEEFEELGFAMIGYSLNAMYGKLRIESELGRGTSFIIEIPQVES